MHKSQIFFYILSSFLSGIFVASVFNIDQVFIYIGFVAAVGLIGVFGYKRNFNGRLLMIGFLGIVFLFGVVRFNTSNLDQSRLDTFTDLKTGGKNIEVLISGYLDSEPVDRGSRQEFVLRAAKVIAGNETVQVNDKVLVTTANFPKFNYGDTVSINGVLQKPQNFGEFDYTTYLKKEGIGASMFYPDVVAYSGLELGRGEELKVNIYKAIFSAKGSFELAVARSVSEPNAAFINGILLGSRQNIPDKLKEAFNATGTTHILAISGYNIMIISWAVLAGLVVFFRRRIAFWLSVSAVCLFVILTGASSSVVRAAIMGILLLLAQGYGRLYEPKNSIILAGAAMVWMNPFALVFDIGFQLSFAAVLGLMYLYPRVDNRLHKLPKLGILKETILMTLSAQIAVAPLLIYYFRSLSLVSLPANVLVVPFLPAAMLTGFTSGLAGMIFLPLGQIIGWFAWAVTTYQIEVVKILGGF